MARPLWRAEAAGAEVPKGMARPLWRAEAAGAEVPIVWRGRYGGPRLLKLRCQMYGEAAMEGRGCWSQGAKCMARPLWRAEAAGAGVPNVWRGRSGGPRLLEPRCQLYGEAAMEGRCC
jgi:hypothetical protein